MDKEIKQIIVSNLLVYKPSFIGVFGSYARNEQTENSDLDLLVSFDNKLTLLDLVKISNVLSEKLKIKIDLVTQKSLHQSFKPYIEKDLQIIYHA